MPEGGVGLPPDVDSNATYGTRYIMAKGAGKARKKLPKELAVIRADNCTGCDACIEVCPVDCIYKVPGPEQPTLQYFCDIDLERCIGCALCERWCPWDAIDMVPTTEVDKYVADKGGPPEYVEKNGPRLVAIARMLADLAKEQQQPQPKAAAAAETR